MTKSSQDPESSPAGREPQKRWADAAERRAATRARFDALSEQERAGLWARLDRLLFADAQWRRARTMPDNPHSYTLRRTWKNDADFVWVVQMIRAIGDREKFPPAPGGRWYDVLNRHGRKVWVMGWPVNYPNGRPWTILLNKKPVEPTDL